MRRLTTNKDVSEMGMYELAHNACYIEEEAMYQDFNTKISARDFARKLMLSHGLWDVSLNEDELKDDDTFDDEMMDLLRFDAKKYPRGLIALFYRNLWAMAELREQLKKYEDLEEQGLLLRVPCKIGDTVYRINEYAKEPIISMRVREVRILRLGSEQIIRIDCVEENNLGESCYLEEHIGKKVFLTHEEALEKMK